MTATISYTLEESLSTLFTAGNFIDELHKYLGLDPAISAANQPVDVSELLKSVLHVIEGDQWRVILEKPITLSLPYMALDAMDNRIYLPYGKVSSITTFAYTDTDEAAQTLDSSNYSLFSEEPAFLWAENWHNIISVSTKSPLPITLTYTTGYSAFDQIPRSTLQAIKILAYHHFVNRGEDDASIPMAYKHHVTQSMFNNRRVQEFL